MAENQVPPHFHKEDRVSERDLIPDDITISVFPTHSAPDGTELTYVNGNDIRRFKMVQGRWTYNTLVILS